ncbi:MAG TPA: VOC family protein [Acidimicrobiia bacterium]|jgi:catechol 2,3-dioxygenase-like lactoylglutathione lyase family enzyme
MLGDTDFTAMVAVNDLDEAESFYEKTLGLTRVDENPAGVEYRSGASRLMVYVSEFAGSNKATNAVWHVDDVDETVRELKNRGTAFERYDNLPGVTRDGDVHVGGEFRIAWFKDPTGNIFEINNGVPR